MGRKISKKNIHKGNFFRNLFRFAIGAMIIPSAAAACFTSAKIIYSAARDLSFTMPALSGAALYSLIAFADRKKGRQDNVFYVAAHEFSHAITAILLGARVFGISIKKTHGSVKLSRSNFIIGLAPYFLPFYAAITAVLYFVSECFWPELNLRPYFLAAAGFFLAFHFIHTAEILLGPIQPDLEEEGGRLFSFPVIFFFSGIASAAILLSMSASRFDIKETALLFANDQKIFYFKIIYLLKYIYSYFNICK